MSKTMLKRISSVCLMVLMGCTTMPDKSAPPERVMPFPFYMALKGNQLIINAINADDHYSEGRLVTVSTDALDQALKGSGNKTPVDFSAIVTSNRLIPSGCGPLMLAKEQLIFYEARATLFNMPFPKEGLSCQTPNASLTNCASVRSASLNHENPLAIALIDDNFAALSYELSNTIDIVSLKDMKVTKSLPVQSWLKDKNIKIPKDERLVIKKIVMAGASRVYFIVERKAETQLYTKAFFGAYLLSVSSKDLLEKEITSADVTLWDLKSDFSILSVHDIFVDEPQKTAYILTASPEALFKLDITKNSVETVSVPIGSAMLALSLTENRVVIPSFNENRVVMIRLSPLALEKVSDFHGQGPAYAVIDETKKLIYVSYYSEGTVAVFDFQLKFLGTLFETAPVNGGA